MADSSEGRRCMPDQIRPEQRIQQMDLKPLVPIQQVLIIQHPDSKHLNIIQDQITQHLDTRHFIIIQENLIQQQVLLPFIQIKQEKIIQRQDT